MAKVKVSTTEGPALNWLVAKCQPATTVIALLDLDIYNGYAPTTNWAQGGPIIEREKIRLDPRESTWHAQIWSDDETEVRHCPTPLIAAMRCYVASRLGDEAEVPDELV